MSVAKPPKALMMGDWKMNYDVVPVKGIGFNAACGGFSEILIGDQDYPASIVARYVLLHDELVAALKGMDGAYCDVTPDMNRMQRMNGRKALIACRAALTKATTP